MKLPPPSAEQTAVVQSVVRDLVHARVDAVAGAGKTTTILHVAAALPDGEALLVLTYNAKLKSETRERCTQMKITNVSVHTYHSAALNLYDDHTCSKDEGIAALVRQPRLPVPCYRNAYSVIVVDEAQDMTHLYFALVQRLLSDVCVAAVRVVVLGDARQSVYGFKGADARFLTLADRLPSFASAARCWRMHTLTTSYRLAPRLARFVNSQLLEGVEVLSSNHTAGGPQGVVRYIRCNTFGDMPFRQVNEWLAAGLHESDVFVLAPSIRVNARHSPVRMLENRLVHAGVRCYAASSDDERLDEDVTRGKIVFATFHQVKGLERKAVMVFNFDASYHRYYARDSSVSGCPNAIYVAATRATHHLTVLHDSKQSPLRTVRMDHITRDCDFVVDGSPYKGDAAGAAHTPGANESSSEVSVTELLRHQKQDVLHAALSCLSVTVFVDRDTNSDVCLCLDPELDTNTLLKSKTQTGRNSWENVAAITGTAMPCMYEYQTNGSCTLLTRAAHAHCSKGLPPADRQRILKLFGFAERERDRETEGLDRSGGRGYSLRRLTVSDFLYIANVHIALTGGFTHKLRQIKVYDWVQPQDVATMLDIMKRHVTGPAGAVLYEHPASMVVTVQRTPTSRARRIKLSCAVDCLDMSTKIAFEIKCVASLSAEHTLQTALNALLLEHGAGSTAQHPQRFRHVLLNLCDGNAREVAVGPGILRAAVILLEAKCAAEQCEDDLTFLESLAHAHAHTHAHAHAHAHVHVQGEPTQTSTPSQEAHYAFLSDDDEPL